MGSLAPWQQMMLGGTSHAPAIASQALTPLAGQAGQMQNILGAAKGLGPAADPIYTLGGKQVAPELLQQSGLAPWQPQPLKQQPSLFKQGLNYITGRGGDETVKGGAGSDMFGGIKEWWEPKSKLEKGAYVAGGAGLLGLAAQPPQQQFAELPTRKVSEFTFEDDVIEKDPRVSRTFTEEELREAVETGPVPSFFANEGGLVNLATGGVPNVFTGHVQGVGDGMSDQIPFRVVPRTPEDIPKAPDMAVLSTDEYVFPADAVSMLGNGSSDAGAKILDNAVKSVRQASIGTPKQITEIDGAKVLGGALTT